MMTNQKTLFIGLAQLARSNKKMDLLDLKVITPRRIVLKEAVRSLTVPATGGEITILPHHQNLLTPLQEGIIKIVGNNSKEEYLAIGGGYLETNGKEISLLVSRAYGQNEIDKEITKQAVEKAKKIITQETDENKRRAAQRILRISKLNLKLKRKYRR